MALVNGPLFSLDASGQVGKAVVYSKWKGRAYVRKYVVPANPDTLLQRQTRSLMKFLSEEWSGLAQADKDSWNTLAAAAGYSPFNAYVASNLNELGAGNGASQNSARGETLPNGVVNALNTTGGIGRIDGTINLDVAPTNVWGIMLRLGTTASPTMGNTSSIFYVRNPSTTLADFEITNLDPGTYQLLTRSMSDDGGYEATSSDSENIVVT